jgi:cyclopropane-fatty-acyl-phospholipid synthase
VNTRLVPVTLARSAVSGDNGLQRLGRRVFLDKLAALEHGQLTVVEADGRQTFGRSSQDHTLQATIEILHPQTYADAAFGGTVGGGEAYIRGYWRTNDLTALVRLFVRNREVMEALEGGAAFVTAPLRRLLHWINRNSRDGSRRNIAAHYDLGNALFALFLDATMSYSCAYFADEATSLHEAQVAKIDRICRKLALQPADHLLEIGTGWGALALHAARHYGCRVTTTTISREQHDWAAAHIAQAGLRDRITLRLDDYRDLTGTYDKLVSVEMIEAVGHQFLDTYLAKCSSLLAPHGAMLLQAITLRDDLYAGALRGVDFIQRYVFPGSFIPSIAAIAAALSRTGGLRIVDLEDIGPHYAATLRHWRRNFMANQDAVRALGYPDEFVRLWEFYLCYCEGGYLERQLGNAQILLARPGCTLQPRR